MHGQAERERCCMGRRVKGVCFHACTRECVRYKRLSVCEKCQRCFSLAEEQQLTQDLGRNIVEHRAGHGQLFVRTLLLYTILSHLLCTCSDKVTHVSTGCFTHFPVFTHQQRGKTAEGKHHAKGRLVPSTQLLLEMETSLP